MTNFTLITEVKKLSEMVQQDGTTDDHNTSSEDIDYTVLTDEDAQRLADFIKEELAGSNLEDDRDVVTQRAFEMIEDIPGLESLESQNVAVKKILALYFGADVT